MSEKKKKKKKRPLECEEYEGRNRHNVEWIFEGVLYFSWPNQPFSGTMGILHWDVFLCSTLPEISKLVDSVYLR